MFCVYREGATRQHQYSYMTLDVVPMSEQLFQRYAGAEQHFFSVQEETAVD